MEASVARKRSEARSEDTADAPVATLPPRTRKGVADEDPRQALAIGVVEDAPHVPQHTATELFTRYARALVANQGDIILALMNVFDIGREEATTRMVELHERCRGASRANTSVGDMIERHDVTVETRVALLRRMAFGADERLAIRAIETLNEMDATAKSRRIGTTWESLVKKVRDRAALALETKKPQRARQG